MINHDSTTQVATQPNWRSALYTMSAKQPKIAVVMGDWLDAKKMYVGRKTARERTRVGFTRDSWVGCVLVTRAGATVPSIRCVPCV